METQEEKLRIPDDKIPEFVDITMESGHQFGSGLLPYYSKKKWIDSREAFLEFYNKTAHTLICLVFIVFNSVVALSSLWLYLNQFIRLGSGIEALRFMLPDQINFITYLFALIYIPLDHRPLFWLSCLFLVYFTWCYSTVTQPIKDKKDRKSYINFVSKRGRKFVLTLTLVQLYFIYSGLFAWYMTQHTYDWFSSIQVTDKPYLKITSLMGLSNVFNMVPIAVSLITAFLIVREFYKTPDLKKRFYEWSFSPLASQSFSLRRHVCDVIVGYANDTSKPIVLSETARFLHTLIVGSTGTGKSSTQLLPVIAQDLVRLARGKRLGVFVLEPKGDLIRDVESTAKELGIDPSEIKIVDPTNSESKIKLNPLAGPMNTAAALWAGTLDALTGDQDKFFKDQQAEVAMNYVLIGKIRHGDSFHFIHHLQQMYTDPRYLADLVEEVRKWITINQKNPLLTQEEQRVLHNYNLICEYFEMSVIEYVVIKDREGVKPALYEMGTKHAGKQVVINKKDNFIAGAKKYVNDISLNPLLSNLFIEREGDIFVDIDDFLDKGGILLCNSALGELEELSLIFGQFIIRQFQSSVFRRPAGKRIPIFAKIDETPLYINEAFERLLTLGRSYMLSMTNAVQSLGQIQAVKDGFERTIVANSNNKFVFGRGELTDNKYFSEHFGEDAVLEESTNESTVPFSMPNQSIGLRHNVQRVMQPRFTPTEIKELKFKHYIAEIVDSEGSIMRPVHAFGLFLNETKILKKFANIGEIQLKTKEYKPLSYSGNFRQLKYLVYQLEPEETKKNDLSTDSDNQQELESTPQPAASEESDVETNPAIDSTDYNALIEWPSLNETLDSSVEVKQPSALYGSDDSSKITQVEDNVIASLNPDTTSTNSNLEHQEDKSSAIVEGVTLGISSENELSGNNISVPDNVDEIISTVQNSLNLAPSSTPLETLPKSVGLYEDDDLFSLAASDRQHANLDGNKSIKPFQNIQDRKDDL